jgi:hypothetical protein
MIRLFAYLTRRVDPNLALTAYGALFTYSPEGLDISENFPTQAPVVELDLSKRSRHFLEDHNLSHGPLQEIIQEVVKAGFALAQKVEKEQQK